MKIKIIAEAENTKRWYSRVLKWEDTGVNSPNKDWYSLDFWHHEDYANGIRLHVKKEDMQKLVDMLNISINHQETQT
jgi:hypothetical protein